MQPGRNRLKTLVCKRIRMKLYENGCIVETHRAAIQHSKPATQCVDL